MQAKSINLYHCCVLIAAESNGIDAIFLALDIMMIMIAFGGLAHHTVDLSTVAKFYMYYDQWDPESFNKLDEQLYCHTVLAVAT